MKLFSKKGIKKLNFSVGKNSYRDWSIFFVFIVLFSIGVLGFSYRVFQRVQSKTISSAPDGRPVGLENLDRTELANTVNKYSEKAAHFEKLKAEKPNLEDPSR